MFNGMKLRLTYIVVTILLVISCQKEHKKEMKESNIHASQILGNPNYLAMCYGGYRDSNHDIEPTIDELKEDMRILSAMGIGIVRTYKLHLPHASNLVKAISELKQEDSNFKMYVMLGIWIDCINAWTDQPLDHSQGSPRNVQEIAKAVTLAQQFPDIIKVLAVGNEAMVHWQAGYFVEPGIILKWVNHLQDLKKKGELSKDLWITSSDNFASWGGGGEEYHKEELNELIRSVDYISMHTYPMHDTHYNPEFWGVLASETELPDIEKIDVAMQRSLKYAIAQYESVKKYMQELGVDKPIHIGETGWATVSNDLYGSSGSKATDEYKEGRYHELIREWTNENGIACFYFEAFDEPWKDAQNPEGSENHFGLFTVEGKAKYPLWDLVDKNEFEGLTRGGNSITKTYSGNLEALLKDVSVPPLKK